MKLSIIIVNYNTAEILNDCLHNLKNIKDKEFSDFEVIVIDNDSPDNSRQIVENNHTWVTLIKSQNKGLSHGYNIGIKNSSGEYILFLGSDAFPQESCISSLLAYFEQTPEVGAATCKLILRDGTLDPDAHRGFPTPWAALTHFSKLNKIFPKSSIFNQYFLGAANLDEIHEIDLCISHFFFVRASIFKKIGLWDEDFFLYGEDVDMCFRIKEAGFKIMYIPSCSAIHYKGSSVGIREQTKEISKATPAQKKKMLKQTTTSMKIFYKKHYSKKYPWFVTAFVLLGISFLSKIRTLGA